MGRSGNRWRVAALVVMGVAGEARAQPVEPTTTNAGASAVETGPTSLDVHSDSPEVSVEALRSAIATELGTEVVLQGSERARVANARVTISYRPASKELAVSYASATHGTVTRVVEAPASAADIITTAAFLVGNLARAQVATPPPAPASAPVPAPAPAAAPANRPAPAAAPANRPAPERLANASFFYPLATNLGVLELRTHLSFNLLYGRVGELSGFELGTLNAVNGKLEGVELGVAGNWVGGDAAGLQLGGLFNVARSIEGLQLTLGVNHTSRPSSGGQLAGVANATSSDLTGLQIAPFNRAGDVSGAQIGVINVARRVKGLQLGLINVAEEVDGVPIGLVSVTRSGGVHPMLWTSTSAYGNVALKFATRYTYTFISVSVHRYGNFTQAGPGLGVGFSVPLAEQAFFEPDISALHLFGNTSCCEGTKFFGARPRRVDQSQFKLRASLRYQAAKHLSLFLGGGVVGRLRYPIDENNDTHFPFDAFLEAFGGLQL
jgi:hypothetical protein